MMPIDVVAQGSYIYLDEDGEDVVSACIGFDGTEMWFFFPGNEQPYTAHDLRGADLYGPLNLSKLVERKDDQEIFKAS